MKDLKLLTLISGITILIFGIGALLIIPEFDALFSGFGGDLPFMTKILITSYRYWLMLLIVPIAIYVVFLNKNELSIRTEKTIKITLIAILVFCGLLIPIVVISMYLPVFQMGVVVE